MPAQLSPGVLQGLSENEPEQLALKHTCKAPPCHPHSVCHNYCPGMASIMQLSGGSLGLCRINSLLVRSQPLEKRASLLTGTVRARLRSRDHLFYVSVISSQEMAPGVGTEQLSLSSDLGLSLIHSSPACQGPRNNLPQNHPFLVPSRNLQ